MVRGDTGVLSSIFGQNLNKVQTWRRFSERAKQKKKLNEHFKRLSVEKKSYKPTEQQNDFNFSRCVSSRDLFCMHSHSGFRWGDLFRVTKLTCAHFGRIGSQQNCSKKNGCAGRVQRVFFNSLTVLLLFNIKMYRTIDVIHHLKEEKKNETVNFQISAIWGSEYSITTVCDWSENVRCVHTSINSLKWYLLRFIHSLSLAL